LQTIITAANTVSRARREHDRDDQRHLDHGDRHRQHQRAERLADAMRDHLRVVHRRVDRRAQRHADQREQQAVARHGIRDAEHDPRDERHGNGPAGQNGRGRGHSGFLLMLVLVLDGTAGPDDIRSGLMHG
jgi:hypothetical protein